MSPRHWSLRPSIVRPVPTHDITPEPGVLLIAPPMMNDPNFRRSVVLLCEHSVDGSFGLILNRPLTVQLSDLIEDVRGGAFGIGQGGPVQPDTLHFIHTLGDLVPNAIPLAEDVYWGGDFEALKVLLQSGDLSDRNVRFYLGYGGWSPGQLLQEIELGGWILAPLEAAEIFGDNLENLWRTSLRRIGGEYAVLANFPEDPRLN